MFELNHSYLTITSYYVVNYEQLSDLIFVRGSLTSWEQNLVQLSHMIATITDS